MDSIMFLKPNIEPIENELLQWARYERTSTKIMLADKIEAGEPLTPQEPKGRH